MLVDNKTMKKGQNWETLEDLNDFQINDKEHMKDKMKPGEAQRSRYNACSGEANDKID